MARPEAKNRGATGRFTVDPVRGKEKNIRRQEEVSRKHDSRLDPQSL